MRRRQGLAPTPQRKIIHTNNRFGNTGIKKQQGTTRILFDSLPIEGEDTFRFFEGANNRDFPLTNMGASGNQLGVGETFVFERGYLAVLTPLNDPPLVVPVGISTFPQIVSGDINLEIANSQVLKPIPILSWMPEFNKNAYHQEYTNFEFDTQIVLPPLLEFVSTLRTVDLATVLGALIRLSYEGVGSIIAPRRTF